MDDDGVRAGPSDHNEGSVKARSGKVAAFGQATDFFPSDSVFLASIDNLMTSAPNNSSAYVQPPAPRLEQRAARSEQRIHSPNIDFGLMLSGQTSPKRSFSQTFGASTSLRPQKSSENRKNDGNK